MLYAAISCKYVYYIFQFNIFVRGKMRDIKAEHSMF
jgi:hypothetical protein